MNVCFISHASQLGGAERSLLEAIDALRQRDVDCRVVIPRHGPLQRELDARRIACRVVPYGWWMGRATPFWRKVVRSVANIACALPLAGFLRLWRIDVVYTNSLTVCVGALASRLANVPHVWQFREFGREDHGLTFDWGDALSWRLIDRTADRYVVASEALARKYRHHVRRDRLTLIRQGVRVPAVPAAGCKGECDSATFAIVGTLQDGKGQEEAIRAIAELVRSGLPATLWVVGGGSDLYRRRLEALATELGIADVIRFTGEVPDAWVWMSKATAVLVCSRAEAFGRATVEAMMTGRPIIGTRSGATPELVSHGETGFLYTPGDHMELAALMRGMWLRPEEAERLGRRGRAWALERFGAEHYGDQLTHLLDGVRAAQVGSAGRVST